MLRLRCRQPIILAREYWVYVPAQYKPDKPACVYINQDGIQWKTPTVFDNLINNKEMPITIGVFITPGRVMADSGTNSLNRFNRSFACYKYSSGSITFQPIRPGILVGIGYMQPAEALLVH